MSRLTVYKHEAFEATAYAFRVRVDFGALPGATTLTGATVDVYAVNTVTGVEVKGAATIVDTDEIDVAFAAGLLTAGIWDVQVQAAPLGYAEDTVARTKVTVFASAASAP